MSCAGIIYTHRHDIQFTLTSIYFVVIAFLVLSQPERKAIECSCNINNIENIYQNKTSVLLEDNGTYINRSEPETEDILDLYEMLKYSMDVDSIYNNLYNNLIYTLNLKEGDNIPNKANKLLRVIYFMLKHMSVLEDYKSNSKIMSILNHLKGFIKIHKPYQNNKEIINKIIRLIDGHL